ncbi:hypothetical protein [Bacillus thuringiensis]|uniref:hypothetical protein n=1 Tax=Bacillus thuringiensis TaxID=1428 RepID=UPI000BF8E9E5|nr:hypothetical protein [Bacillus thuringiensis]PEV40338.1 hypothetical protein CN426_20970 [Bacillus thuringiensis]
MKNTKENTEKKKGNRSISKLSSNLQDALAEGRQKYGDDCLVINKGTEYKPNWVAVKHPRKSNAGIKEPDMFDHSWYQNNAK